MWAKLYNGILDTVFPVTTREHIVKKLYDDKASLEMTPRKNTTTSGTDVTTLLEYNARYVRKLIHSLKFYNSQKSAYVLAHLLNDYLVEYLADRMLYESAKTLIVPVPLSKKRKRERGFNQIERVLDELIKINGDFKEIVNIGMLTRTKHTTPQTRLNKKDRLSNLAGAFEVKNTCKANLQNTHIIVLDDICTTGATLAETKGVLEKTGCKKVMLLAFAHA